MESPLIYRACRPAVGFENVTSCIVLWGGLVTRAPIVNRCNRAAARRFKEENVAEAVGRTPWSAADALVGLFQSYDNVIPTVKRAGRGRPAQTRGSAPRTD